MAKIEDNIITIKVDGYDYNFPQQMIPSEAMVNDRLLITQNQIELIKVTLADVCP